MYYLGLIIMMISLTVSDAQDAGGAQLNPFNPGEDDPFRVRESDFRTENFDPNSIEGDGDCGLIADLGILIDTSRSLGPYNFQKELRFVNEILSHFRIGYEQTRVGVLSFSAGTRLEFTMDKYFNSEEVLRAVKNINYTDGMCTLIYRGLEQARTDIFNTDTGARPDIQDVAIVLTDGETNPGRMDPYSLPYAKTLTRQEANKLKMNGVNVFGIGVGPRVDHAEMIGISSGERNYLRVGDIDDLNVKQLLDNVIGKICEKPEKIVQPPVRNNSCTNSPADIFFVVDKSSSLRSVENFNKELSFIARFVDGFNVGPGPRDSRVGLLTFSTDAKFEFGLNDYRTKTELQNALLNVKYTMGDTYTHKALNMMLEQGFRFQTRPGVPRIGIIMTDGHSTDPYSLNIAVEEVRKSGIDVFAIGFGDYGLSELNLMATDPDSTHVFVVDDVTSLDYVRDDLYLQVCDTIGVKSNYTLTFGLENNRIP